MRKTSQLRGKQIAKKATKLSGHSEARKGILHYYGSGIWKGDLKASRKNRV